MLQETCLAAPGSCLQFCPCPGQQQCLVVGTYQLNEQTQTRSGHLLTYEVNASAQHSTQHTRQASALISAGVFDLAWSTEQTAPVLAAALSNGNVRLLKALQCKLQQSAQISCFDAAMAACVDWSNRQPGLLGVCSSDGKLGV